MDRGVLSWLAEGDLSQAEAVAQEALAIALHFTFRWEATISLELLASIATASHSEIEALRLYGAASRLRDDFNSRFVLPGQDSRMAIDHIALRRLLGDDGYDTAFAEGYALTLEEAAEYAQRARGERKRPTLGRDGLTPTELQVIAQLRAGLTNPQIAERLLMSRETVKTHLSHVFTKLDVKSRSALAAAATSRIPADGSAG